MPDFDEKRDYIRMDSNCQMSFKFVDSDQQYNATCINISGAGILFKVDQEIEVGRALEIVINPKNNVTPPLDAFVEIIRVSAEGSGSYEIAATIKGIKSN